MKIQTSDKTNRASQLAAVLLLAVASAFAQTYTVAPYPNQQWLDNNGNPLSGSHLYTCIAGNSCSATTPPSNPQSTYNGANGTINANPVVADSAGRMNVWLVPGLSYRLDLYTSTGVLVWSVDNVTSPALSNISTCGANAVVAGPTTGSPAAPTCRSLVSADLPNGLYADPALDNLVAPNINTALLAQTGVDLGSTVKPFRNLFLFGAGTYGSTYLELTGAPTSTRTVTFPDASDTVVELGVAQTLTNKTFTAPVIATIVNSGTLTLPTSSDTLVGRATTDTLTNKTLTAPVITNPVITGPAAVACGTSCSVASTQNNVVFLLNQAAGSAATLPTSTGSGNVYKFRTTVALGSNQNKILLLTTSDVIIGYAIGENASTTAAFVGNAGTYHSIQMPFAGSRPSGGFVGDTITCTDITAGSYACDVMYQGGTAPSTPYSTSTT